MAPFLAGHHVVYFSPISFIVAPELWVIAAARYGANHMQAPDFGYKLAAKRGAKAAAVMRAEELDLKALCFCLSAAERVRVATCAEFEAHFRDEFSFDAMFCPAYGLAESVVGVCSTGTVCLPAPRKLTSAEELVCSNTRPDLVCVAEEFLVVVKIVNKETRQEKQSGSPGEIWVSSSSVAMGYWGKAELSEEIFRARLDPDGGVLYNTAPPPRSASSTRTCPLSARCALLFLPLLSALHDEGPCLLRPLAQMGARTCGPAMRGTSKRAQLAYTYAAGSRT